MNWRHADEKQQREKKLFAILTAPVMSVQASQASQPPTPTQPSALIQDPPIVQPEPPPAQNAGRPAMQRRLRAPDMEELENNVLLRDFMD